MQSPNTARNLKSYESPTLKKLEPEEAKKFLVHHVNMGDSGAKEVLALVLPGEAFCSAGKFNQKRKKMYFRYPLRRLYV